MACGSSDVCSSFIPKIVNYKLNSNSLTIKQLAAFMEPKFCQLEEKCDKKNKCPVTSKIRQKNTSSSGETLVANNLQESTPKTLYTKKQLLEQPDNNGETALFHAVRDDSINNLRLLLQCGANAHHRNKLGETAVDLCYKRHAWSCLLLLLQNDSPFPRDFNENNIPQSETKLVKFIKNNNEISRIISHGKIEQLALLVDRGQISKCFRNIKNQSAVVIAFVNKQFESYVFLKTNGFGQIFYEVPIDSSTLSSVEKLLLKNVMSSFVRKTHPLSY